MYQGNYNCVARHGEAELLPLLRTLILAFYAYSPIAGGFLVRTVDEMTNGSEGRWDKNSQVGGMYHKLYNRPSLMQALAESEHIAQDAAVPKAAFAYRWMAYHSALKLEFGDGIIVGASRPTQLEQTLAALEDGPLDEKTVTRIEHIWEMVKDEAPIDNFNS